jgi:ring-1,2-phenylacetyl-CoA epoxidase subunit PaaE
MKSMNDEFFDLTVSAIVKGTSESITIFLSIPESLKNKFSWKAGQYVKVGTCINGAEHLRSYSISAPMYADEMSITVKRISGGLVSTYLTNKLKHRDMIRVTSPMGNFTLTTESKNKKSYIFICAGSGITPIFSMIKSVLALEKNSFIYLLYGNRNAKSAIFRQALANLQEEYNHKTVISYCYSAPTWFGVFSSGHKGRVTPQTLKYFLSNHSIREETESSEYYICGPGSFIPMVKAILNDLNITDNSIHIESFGSKEKLFQSPKKIEEMTLIVQLKDKTHQLLINDSEYLLESLKRNNINAPHSCESGTCGTCKCQLIKGAVDMEENYFLSTEEIEQGFILACQSVPKTEKVHINFPD